MSSIFRDHVETTAGAGAGLRTPGNYARGVSGWAWAAIVLMVVIFLGTLVVVVAAARTYGVSVPLATVAVVVVAALTFVLTLGVLSAVRR